MVRKKSFFEKITGVVKLDEDEISREELDLEDANEDRTIFEEEEEGQLTVDVYETPSEIVVRTMVAGVKPDDLDVDISRESVTIRGKRSEEKSVSDEDYFHRELYWGSFSRTLVLPAEIDVDEAEAVEKHGVLTLHLPKLDKNRQTKLKVKGS